MYANFSAFFQWTPSSLQEGSFLRCFESSLANASSSPVCLTLRVTAQAVSLPTIAVDSGASFHSGTMDSVAVAASATIASTSFITRAVVQLSGVVDEGAEELMLPPSAAMASLGIFQAASEIIIVSGKATVAVYEQVLRAVVYTNSMKRPTLGTRAVSFRVTNFDGVSTAVLTDVEVVIDNVRPALLVDTNDQASHLDIDADIIDRFDPAYIAHAAHQPYLLDASSGLNYSTIFYAQGKTVLVTGHPSVIDSDSDLSGAKLVLSPIPDGDSEQLLSHYVAPPLLETPGIHSSGLVYKRFGNEPLNATTSDTIEVSVSNASVVDIDVVVDIGHSWIGDVVMELEHAGRIEVLTLSPGGSACSTDDFATTVFDSSSSVNLVPSMDEAGACEYQSRGSYLPAGSLDGFVGMAAGGEWTLHLKDLELPTDDGVLNSWAVIIRTDAANISTVNTPIPRMTLSNTDVVREHTVYLGDRGKVEDLNVGLQLYSSDYSKLTVTLEAPDGTSIRLINGADCEGKVGRNHGYIIFDDQAAADAPWCDTNALEGLAVATAAAESMAPLVGTRIVGTWKLRIEAEPDALGLSVELYGWSLTVNSRPNIEMTYTSATGVMELSGLDTAEAYNEFIGYIAYHNGAVYPDTALRTVTAVATDEFGASSLPAVVRVAIHHLDHVELRRIDEDAYTYPFGDVNFGNYNDVGDVIAEAVPAENGIILRGDAWTRSTVNDRLGIAVIEVDETNGRWEYSTDAGLTFNNFTQEGLEVTASSAVTLYGVPPEENFIRYVPDLNYHENATFKFMVWEWFSYDSNGKHNVSTLERNELGTATTTATIRVDPVNDSPIISGTANFQQMTEDAVGSNMGDLIGSQLFQSFLPEVHRTWSYTDVDLATPTGLDYELGIAVIHVDNDARGTWRWNCPTATGSAVYQDFIGGVEGRDVVEVPDESHATLLDASCRIRFEPNANFNTDLDLNGDEWGELPQPHITFKAWDNTGDTYGKVGLPGYDTLVSGGFHNEYSAETVKAYITVFPMPDNPILTVHDASLERFEVNYFEDGAKVPLVDPDSVTLTDVDHARMKSISVVLLNANDGLGDVLEFDTNGTSLTVSTAFSGDDLVYKLIPADDGFSAIRDEYVTVLSSATYHSSLEEPTSNHSAGFPIARNFELHTTDEEDLDSEVVFSRVYVWPTNDIPVVDLSGTPLTVYKEGEYGTPVAPTATIFDNDNTTMVKLTVTLLDRPDGHEERIGLPTAQNKETSSYTLHQMSCANDGNLERHTDKTVEECKALCEADNDCVGFEYGVDYSGDAGTYQPGDCQLSSSVDMSNCDGAANNLDFYIRELVQFPFFDNFEPEPETEASPEQEPEGEVPGPQLLAGVTHVYDQRTGILTIAGLANRSWYEYALRSIQYSNSRFDYHRGDPTVAKRRISVVVDDSINTSVVVFTAMTFVAVNDEPYIDVTGASTEADAESTFVEEQGAVRLFPDDLGLYDIDNDTLAYINVTITNTLDGDLESLAYTPYVDSSNLGNGESHVHTVDPEATYDPVTQTLRIEGLNSVDDYQKILRSITYDNLADEPDDTPRVISVIANDGLLDSVVRFAVVSVTMVNDAPRINTTVNIPTPQIPEDNRGATYFAVSSIASWGVLLEDDDAGAVDGIAVVAVDNSNGVWEYLQMTKESLETSVPDASSDWQSFAPVTAENAVLLDVSDKVFLRYTSNQDFHGTASIAFVAWDQHKGRASGSRADTTYGPLRAFSAETATFTIEVTPENDHPVVGASVAINGITLVPILEDDYTSDGKLNDVYDIVQAMGATDVDGPTPTGVAAASVDAPDYEGHWEYSLDGGATFTAVPAVSRTSALLLSGAEPGTNYVRYVPALDFHGTAGIELLAWDETQFAAGDVVSVASFAFITSPFSERSTTATVIIEPVNDSPIVTDGGMLTAIWENTTSSNIEGDTVASIIAGHYSDVDAADGDAMGIAVVATDVRYGNWFWKCSESRPFSRLIGGIAEDGHVYPETPTYSKATLLADTCKIKFVPNVNFNTVRDLDGVYRLESDRPFITFVGWDRTDLVYPVRDTLDNGTTYNEYMISKDYAQWPGTRSIDTVYRTDHRNPFGEEPATAKIRIKSIDTRPALRLGGISGGYESTYIEGGAPVGIVNPEELILEDVDNATLLYATIEITNVQDRGYEIITFDQVDHDITKTQLEGDTSGICVDVGGSWADADGHKCDWYNENTFRCNGTFARRRNRRGITQQATPDGRARRVPQARSATAPGKCGVVQNCGSFIPGDGADIDDCFCDADCVGFGDCCSDYVATCASLPPPECAGRCNSNQALECNGHCSTGTCYCDDECIKWGDCCPGFEEKCPTTYEHALIFEGFHEYGGEPEPEPEPEPDFGP
jgi:subtilisin-like proprotein convertase family protein